MITAFGKKVNREKAYKIIFNEYVCAIAYSRNYSELEDLLMEGWKSLEEWSDKELEEFIEGLCVANQPGGKI
jgi:hypothetical protein